jgi:hypothetical protein
MLEYRYRYAVINTKINPIIPLVVSTELVNCTVLSTHRHITRAHKNIVSRSYQFSTCAALEELSDSYVIQNHTSNGTLLVPVPDRNIYKKHHPTHLGKVSSKRDTISTSSNPSAAETSVSVEQSTLCRCSCLALAPPPWESE